MCPSVCHRQDISYFSIFRCASINRTCSCKSNWYPIPLVQTHSLLVYEWKLIAFKPVYVSWQENTKSNFQTCTKEDPKNFKRMKRSQGREKLQLQKTCINHAMSGKQTILVCYCSRINFSWNIDIINKKKNKNVRTASSQEKRKNHKNLYFGSFSPD